MTTEQEGQMEQMAIAVLRKDYTAARQLSDTLQEEFSKGATLVIPATKITVPFERLRVAVFMDDTVTSTDSDVDVNSLVSEIYSWLQGAVGVIILPGVSRLEFWEMPETAIPKPPTDSEPLR